MRILIVDDNQLNLDNAIATLLAERNNEVVTCNNAQDIATGMELGTHHRDKSFHQAFDIAVFDLMMPVIPHSHGTLHLEHLNQEMPYGIFLAMMAARTGMAKTIAVATATNHHHHPMPGFMGYLGPAYWNEDDECPSYFRVNDSTIHFFHAPMARLEGIPCPQCKDRESQLYTGYEIDEDAEYDAEGNRRIKRTLVPKPDKWMKCVCEDDRVARAKDYQRMIDRMLLRLAKAR